MKLSEIWVYPIKSLGGISVSTAKALPSGLEMDRRYMLVGEDDKFMTQRQLPAMATLGSELSDLGVSIFEKAKPANRIEIPHNFNSETSITATIWEALVDSFVAPELYNEWFSDYFGEHIRLIRMNPKAMRNRDLAVEPFNTDMSYADGYPYLVLSKSSVQKLNQELESEGHQAVDIRQFRANLILDDCEPFEEDELKSFSVGDCNFNMVKPCARCPVITINQDTGVASKEPLKHLARTRNAGNKVIFGMNAALVSGSTINEGDEILVN